MMRRLGALAVNLAVAAASVSLCFGVLEVAARLARSRQRGGKEQRTRTLYTEHDSLLGWRKAPGARALYERREYTVELVVNGKGLRDRDREYTPAEGTLRILQPFSLFDRFQVFARGAVDTRDVSYLVLFTVAFLSFTFFALDSRRWRGLS